jgi:hypothetical protein
MTDQPRSTLSYFLPLSFSLAAIDKYSLLSRSTRCQGSHSDFIFRYALASIQLLLNSIWKRVERVLLTYWLAIQLFSRIHMKSITARDRERERERVHCLGVESRGDAIKFSIDIETKKKSLIIEYWNAELCWLQIDFFCFSLSHSLVCDVGCDKLD